MDPSRPREALRLLDCLRGKVAELYRVGIVGPDDGRVLVTDQAGSVDNLPAFLDEMLDQCAQAMGIPDRKSHLS